MTKPRIQHAEIEYQRAEGALSRVRKYEKLVEDLRVENYKLRQKAAFLDQVEKERNDLIDQLSERSWRQELRPMNQAPGGGTEFYALYKAIRLDTPDRSYVVHEGLDEWLEADKFVGWLPIPESEKESELTPEIRDRVERSIKAGTLKVEDTSQGSWEDPCPHPKSRGLHEVYVNRAGRQLCRACGRRSDP